MVYSSSIVMVYTKAVTRYIPPPAFKDATTRIGIAAMASRAPTPWLIELAISSPSVYSRTLRSLFAALADVFAVSWRIARMLA